MVHMYAPFTYISITLFKLQITDHTFQSIVTNT